ncbi:7918_t:CDS:2 [Acaulospora colombiana]|uniref:7918_t:CDS:1 n=1 Tax=Acaulospora colombiana TaxID=27376 RepID=A0ACA9M371_9GLOM|nr:7918_t:CDS:2 [Acaulospora colombiana]
MAILCESLCPQGTQRIRLRDVPYGNVDLLADSRIVRAYPIFLEMSLYNHVIIIGLGAMTYLTPIIGKTGREAARAVRHQDLKRLQEGGDWDRPDFDSQFIRVYSYLREQLNEAGWLDDLYDGAKGEHSHH